jgi:hypothetical protein
MTIDWLYLSAALFLLLTPTAALQGGKTRFRAISTDWERHWGQIFSHGFHAVDFGRAILGAWLLAAAFEIDPGTRGLWPYAMPATQAAVVFLGVGAQTIFCRHADSFNAPFTFVAGAVLGLFPPLIGGFALVIAVVLAAGSRTPAAFFPVLALSLPAIGFLFAGKKLLPSLGAGSAAVLLPWLLALMFSRELVIAFRARRLAKVEQHESSPLR